MSKNKQEYFANNTIKYKSILRRNKDKQKYIKIKILKSALQDNTLKIINNNNNNININELKTECYIKLLLNINAIWINNNIFGVFIKPILIKKIEIINNINFIEDSDIELKSVIDSCIDSDIKTITENYNPNKNKVLISTNNNSSINNITLNNNSKNNITNSITSYNNNDDLSTVNFNNLDDIPEYNNDTKRSLSSTS